MSLAAGLIKAGKESVYEDPTWALDTVPESMVGLQAKAGYNLHITVYIWQITS